MKFPDERPWTVEVPIKKSQFETLFARHKQLNVEVDLAEMSGYSYVKKSLTPQNVLHCDFQLDPMVETFPRLGAGRAGVHRGHYLKGVGKTTLAANWNWSADILHHTGHLRACAAIRELIVTDYLRAKGLGDTIVPCEGILLKPLSSELRGFFKIVTEGREKNVKPLDLKFQAISVKPANFVRYSNLYWLAENRTARPDSIEKYISNFIAALGGSASAPFSGKMLTSLVDLNVERLKKFFFRSIRIGLNWNAYHNNFATDGRFVDIEGPLILGSPFLGNLHDETYGEQFCFPHVGFELIYALRQVHGILFGIAARLDTSLKLNRDIRGEHREKAIAFISALKSVTERRISKFSWECVRQDFADFFLRDLELNSKLTRELLKYAEGVHRFYFGGSDRRPEGTLVREKKRRQLLSPNTVQKLVLEPFRGFEPALYNYSDSAFLDEILRPIENSKSIDSAFNHIELARKEIARTIR